MTYQMTDTIVLILVLMDEALDEDVLVAYAPALVDDDCYKHQQDCYNGDH